METTNGKQGDKKAPGNDEMFDVRDLVAKDPDLPKRVFEPKRKKKGSRHGKAPAGKNTRKTSGNSSIYIFLTLAVLFLLIVVPAVIFIFIRYVLPRGE